MSPTTIINTSKLIVFSLAVGFFVSYAGAWTGPTVVPPNCPTGAVGCDSPLHTGTNLQTKSGALWANFFGTTGSGYFGGNVGIGTQAPTAKLQVHGAVRMIKEGGPTPGTPFFGADGYYGTATGTTDNEIGGSVAVDLRRARGTLAAPLPVKNGDRLGGIVWAGWDGGSFYGANGNAAAIQAFARENFTGTAHGTSLQFETTPVGTETRATRMTIAPDGKVGIGTQSPGAALHVIGNGVFEAPENSASAVTLITKGAGVASLPANSVSTDNGLRGWTVFGRGSTYSQTGETSSQNDFGISYWNGTSWIGNNYFRINAADGNVGIGKLNPAHKLDVAGTVKATGDICTDAGGGKCLSTAGGGAQKIRFDKWVEARCGEGAGYMRCGDGWIQTGGGHWGVSGDTEKAYLRCARVDPVYVKSNPIVMSNSTCYFHDSSGWDTLYQ